MSVDNPRKRADAEANRAALIAAARRLVSTHGRDLKLSAVAAAAGVGIATLYRNFASQEELILAVVSDFGQRILELVDQRRQAASTGDPEEVWTSFVRGIAQLRPGVDLLELTSAMAVNGMPADLLALRQEGLLGVEEALADARVVGLVAPEVNTQRFLLGLATITRPLPHHEGDEGWERWLIETYIRGLRPR